MGSLEVRYLEVERQLWIRDSRRVCEQLKLQYCMVGERYIGRYESDRKQGQTNSWGELILSLIMICRIFSIFKFKFSIKRKDGSSCVAVLNVGKDIAEISLAE